MERVLSDLFTKPEDILLTSDFRLVAPVIDGVNGMWSTRSLQVEKMYMYGWTS